MKIFIILMAISLASGGAMAQAPNAKNQPKNAARKALKKEGKGMPVLEKLRTMSPADRSKVLANMPPERRQRLEARLENYDRMPERQKKNVERFQQLPVAQQQQVRKVYQRFNQLPVERRATLRREVNKITPMDQEARKTYLGSEKFRAKYNDEEQQMIHQLADSFPVEK